MNGELNAIFSNSEKGSIQYCCEFQAIYPFSGKGALSVVILDYDLLDD